MEEFSKLQVVVASAGVIQKLNKSIFDGSNQEKVPALNTNEIDVKVWWNNLFEHDKCEVIGLALHYTLTTANSRWGLGNFEDYSKPKQRIIKTIFNKRKSEYKAFDLMSMLKL